MSIGTEITRLANAKSAIATAITNKGVTVPSSTKLDGMAALINSIANQAELESITVKTPPTKLDYISGDTFDATGLVLTVLVGEVEIDITSGYTITPETMAADTTAVTISYTAGGKTVSTTQAVTVKAYDPVLANNSWEKIIEACEAGYASELWSVGDISPTIELYGQTVAFRIIGFNHDDLDTTDAKYGSASYNNGSNKAAVTFDIVNLIVNSNGTGWVYNADLSGSTSPYWQKSTLKTQTLPDVLALFPEALKNSIRIVQKKTYRIPWDSPTLHQTADKLFLLSHDEVATRGKGEGTIYSYYAAGNSRAKTKVNGNGESYYLRGPSLNNDYSNLVGVVLLDGTISSGKGSDAKPLSFSFCL